MRRSWYVKEVLFVVLLGLTMSCSSFVFAAAVLMSDCGTNVYSVVGGGRV